MLARVWLCLIALCLLHGSGSEPVCANERLNEAWRWVTFTTDSGLPSDEIIDLVETPRGTTWVATQAGVARFDKYRWVAATEDHGLPTGPATWIEPIGDDEVLVVIRDRLWRGSAQSFRAIPILDQGEIVMVVAAVPVDGDRIFVLGRRVTDGVHRLYDIRGSSVSQQEIPGQILTVPFRRLWKLRSGSIFISTDKGLFKFDGHGWIPHQQSDSDWYRVNFLAENAAGQGVCHVYFPREVLGTWSWATGGEMERMQFSFSEQINCGDVKNDGEVIALSQSGEVVVRQQGAWRQLPPTMLKLQSVSFLRYARDGNLWVGTQEGLNLCHLTSERWSYWRDGADINRKLSNALLQDRDGSFWIGTGAGLEHRRADGTLIEFIEQINEIPITGITGLQQDRHGRIWISSGADFEGVFRRDSKGWSHIGPAEGMAAPHVHRIFKDRQGRLWFAGMGTHPMKGLDDGPGAFLLHDDDRFEVFDRARGLLAGRVYAVTDAPDGSVWFATMLGLSRLRDGQWRHWTQADGLRHMKVFIALATDDGRLWFGQQEEGLGFIDPDGKVQYCNDVPPSLQRISICDMKVGPTGCFWVATSRGLFWQEKGEWTHVSRRFGLENPSAWVVLPLKDRVLAGTDGSGTVVLQKTFEDLQPPIVVINPLATEGDFVAAHWNPFSYLGAIPEKLVSTRYRLDDGPWSPWSLQRTMSMESVPHGKHTLEVQARGMFGATFEVGTRATFGIQPPLYLRPWVVFPIGILALIAAVLIVMLFQRRKRHLATLAASKNQLQAILDATPSVVYLKSVDWRYISINSKFEELFHITRDRIIGKTDYDLFSPEMADQFRRNDERVIQNRQDLLIEEIAPHDDGPHHYISAKFPLYDASNNLVGLCGISTDITDSKRAEEMLRDSEARFRATLGQAAVGIAESDLSGRYLLVNQRFCDIVGYSESELMGSTFQKITHPDDLADDLKKFDLLLQGTLDNYSMEKRYIRRDRTAVWVNLAVSLVRTAAGTPSYCIAVVEDISDRKIAESHVIERAQHAALAARIGFAFTGGGRLSSILDQCAAALVEHLKVAMARIYLFGDDERTITLDSRKGLLADDLTEADAATWNQRARPVIDGCRAELTNAIQSDSSGAIREWTCQNGIVAVACHPLTFESRRLGAILLMSREPLRETTAHQLDSLADVIALGVNHKKAEETLENEREFLKALLASLTEGIVACDADGNITLYNNEFSGLHPNEATRVPAAEWASHFHLHTGEGDRLLELSEIPLYRALLGETLKNEAVMTKPPTRPPKNLSVSGRPISAPDGRLMGAVIAVHDVTEQRRAEDILRRHALVFENIHDGVIIFDLDNRILDCNAATERMFGYPRQELFGKFAELLNRPEDAPIISSMIRNGLSAQNRWEGEICIVRKDGSEGIIETVIVPMLDDQARTIGTIAVSRDITVRKKSEAERAALSEQLKQSQKMEAVGTLAAGIAHDFNNLLQAISGYTETAKATLPADHPGVASLGMVEHASRQARGVINALLTFTHRGSAEKYPIDLREVVESTSRLLQRIMPSSVSLRVEYPKTAVWINADTTQIQQIIMNLCINSRDAMPGGGTLTVSVRERDGEQPLGIAELCIADNGEGMQPFVLARLFEPFFTTKPRGKGTGLGMSITHTIVTDHQGTIDVNTAPGRGTSVIVHLPLCTPPVAREPAVPLRSHSGFGELILVVEDNEHIRSLMVSTLRARNYAVLAASKLDDALTIFSSGRPPIQLIVLDRDVAGPPHLADDLIRRAEEGQVTVLQILGVADTQHRATATPETTLIKPFQLQELTTRVAECLARSREGVPT